MWLVVSNRLWDLFIMLGSSNFHQGMGIIVKLKSEEQLGRQGFFLQVMATPPEFYRKGNDWFCHSSLPSDIKAVVDDVNFHLHKFPLITRCGRIANAAEVEQSQSIVLEDFPGGADTFLTAVKFCYNGHISFTPANIVTLYCASDYLEMSNDLGEDNLLSRSENYFHKRILTQWKDCISALQPCRTSLIPRADKLGILDRCLNAMAVMICTDPSLFGWPMKMYGSMQSPGGSILWNGINTGARLQSIDSVWWFEDVSCLNVELFKRLIQTMQVKGIRSENIARTIMYYCEKHLPGSGQRWKAINKGISSKAISLNTVLPSEIDQRSLLESVIKILPEKKGKTTCRFLMGLLRVALILGAGADSLDLLEGKIGAQMEFASLDGLLIPNYSDAEALYNTDCVERIVRHFVRSEQSSLTAASPSSLDLEISPSSPRFVRVAKLVDNYIAEVASDVSLKPGKFRSMAEALPESYRSLHDGLYRALDIYFKTHPWLSDKERESLCTVIDFQKLSIDACAHASQNERLPLRIVLQVLFFEQMQLRAALANYLQVIDVQGTDNVPSRVLGQSHENEALKLDMERMRARVGELGQEFGRIKEVIKKVGKKQQSHQTSSPQNVAKARRSGFAESTVSTPTASIEQPQLQTTSRLSLRRRSSSFF